MRTLQEIGPDGCRTAFTRYRDGDGALTGAGPLAAYMSPTTHASLAMYARMGQDLLLEDPQTVPSLAGQVPKTRPDQLLVIEASHAVALRTALDLAASSGLWPLLTSRMRYHPYGLLGDAQTASLLLLDWPRAAHRTGWCLVLDADRNPPGPVPAGRYDNRQPLRLGELPWPHDLQAVGIREICLFSRLDHPTDQPCPEPQEDLCEWLAQFGRARINTTWL